MQAVLCPVCGGSGNKRIAPSVSLETTECHSCSGKGWVEIGAAPCPSYPSYPWPACPIWCSGSSPSDGDTLTDSAGNSFVYTEGK